MRPEQEADFDMLMERVTEGSQDAAWELVERYGEVIRRAVRSSLDERLRSKFDSLDFVQLVWSSFFRAGVRTRHFSHPSQLAAFLIQVARNKVAMETRRRLKTERTDVKREISLEGLCDHSALGPASREASPIDLAIARERWSRMIDEQPERRRQIISMKLQGHTCQGIADCLGITEKTVRRFLKELLAATAADLR